MKHKFDTLQAGRGFAAVAVVLFHIGTVALLEGQSFCHGIFLSMNRGVDFFFVLSGFIIYHTNRTNIGRPVTAPFYFYRRLTRIYPLLIFFTCVKVAYLLVDPESIPAYKRNLSYILVSFLLFPQEKFPLLDVAWTLCYEMFFYTIFLFAILFGRPVRNLCLAHAFACFLFSPPFFAPLHYPASFLFNPLILEFYAGVAIAWLISKPSFQPSAGTATVSLMVGLVTLTVAACIDAATNPDRPWYIDLPYVWCAGSSLVILGLVVLERMNRIRAAAWMVYLGDASYSIYLTHVNVQRLLVVLSKRFSTLLTTHTQMTYWVIGLISLVSTFFVYEWIEKPLLKWFHARGPRKPALAPTTAIDVRQTMPVQPLS